MSRLLWMTFQVAAVAGLMWFQIAAGPQDETPPLALMFVIDVLIVAGLTALLTRGADRLARAFRRRPIHQERQPEGERLSLGARRRLPGNLPE